MYKLIFLTFEEFNLEHLKINRSISEEYKIF